MPKSDEEEMNTEIQVECSFSSSCDYSSCVDGRLSFSDSCSPVDKNKSIEDERDCRICHMSLVLHDAIELGCCCKEDLAATHKHCALTWFQIRGNKTCEICNSTVTNLVIPNEMTTSHATIDMNLAAATSHMTTTRGGGGGAGCINGHRLVNFILACLVFAFVISWLFHFNIPS